SRRDNGAVGPGRCRVFWLCGCPLCLLCSGRPHYLWREIMMDHRSAARLGGLRDKLSRGGLTEVSFLVVNEQEAQSRAMYWELKRRTAEGIPVYQQSPLQSDVWETLQGDKDDFLVYDRCGQLTFHIVLPYSFLHYPYVEAAIRATYRKDICNCTVDSNSTLSADLRNSSSVAKGENQTMTSSEPTRPPVDRADHHSHHHHDHPSQSHGHTSHSTNPLITKAGESHHSTHNTEHEGHITHKHEHHPADS
ncbi:hypothetical protein SRHO_G00245470, partial [Serrasalmus rhombeus]